MKNQCFLTISVPAYILQTRSFAAPNMFSQVFVWYDERLREVVCKLEKFYATSLAFLLGMVTICFLCMGAGVSDGMIVLALVSWILADCLLVSPLIYYIALPKPVKAHIKDVDKLTLHEKEIYEKERGCNERLEKLMKTYKSSGRKSHE